MVTNKMERNGIQHIWFNNLMISAGRGVFGFGRVGICELEVRLELWVSNGKNDHIKGVDIVGMQIRIVIALDRYRKRRIRSLSTSFPF